MEILKYYSLPSEKQELFRAQIGKAGWSAADYLYSMLTKDEFIPTCGEGSEVLLLVENDRLLSFCTYAGFDEIDDPSMTPWLGFVFTFPFARGRRLAGLLLDYGCRLAKSDGYDFVYISSEERGLYEKYGFDFIGEADSIHDYVTGIYRKKT